MPPNNLHNENNKFFGFYRARVTAVDLEEDGEVNKYGSIKVFVPDLMISQFDDEVDEHKSGIIAYPANGLIGGFNEDAKEANAHFAGSVIIPLLHSYVWVFFEGGLIDRPFYFSPFSYRNIELLPENRNVDTPHKVYTLLKSGEGRAIVISDSVDQQRVEITGKKRMLKEGPVGDTTSVYVIDGNQTTILLDETNNAERLLIKTHEGDYINLDITNRELNIEMKNDIKIKTDGKLHIQCAKGIEIKSDKDIAVTSGEMFHMKSGKSMHISSEKTMNIKSNDFVNIDGKNTYIQSKKACPGRRSAPKPPSAGKVRRPPSTLKKPKKKK